MKSSKAHKFLPLKITLVLIFLLTIAPTSVYAADSTLGGVNITLGGACPQAGDTVFNDSTTHILVCSGGVWTAYSPSASLAINADTAPSGKIVTINAGVDNFLSYLGTRNLFLGTGAGNANSTGNSLTFIGYRAGYNNTTSCCNTFVGENSGKNTTTGQNNTFIGEFAGYGNTTGEENTFIGSDTGGGTVTGFDNTFVGYNSGNADTSGGQDSFFGRDAGKSNTTGANNAFLGYSAGSTNTTGIFNVFVGSNAGISNTSASYNTFVGGSAGYSNTTGTGNVFVGNAAGYFSTTGFTDTFIGSGAGNANTTGSNNNFMGYTAGTANTTGGQNVFIGRDSGVVNTTGSNNIFVGHQSGNTNTTGERNILLGYNVQAPAAATNWYLNIGNVIYGTTGTSDATADAKADASGAITIDGNLTVTGTCTGCSGSASLPVNLAGAPASKRIMEVTSGGTVFMGFKGTDNVYIGNAAGAALDSAASPGNANTFLGSGAGTLNTTGVENTLIGWNAGSSITNTGAYNTLIGASAGKSITTAQAATFIGDDAGLNATSANFSIAIGDSAGMALTSGNNNTIVGRSAGDTYPTTGERNTLIGYDVQSSAAGTNWYVNLANVIYGSTGTSDATADATGDGSATLTIDGSTTFGGTGYIQVPAGTTAQRPGTPIAGMIRYCTSGASCPGGANGFEVYKGSWTDMGAAASSDIRLKTNLKKLDGKTILDQFSKAQAYSFEYKDSLGAKHYGVIAQEFEKLFPELVYSPPNNGMKSVRYLEFTGLLLEAVKETNRKLENNTSEIASMRKELEAEKQVTTSLKDQLEDLRKELAEVKGQLSKSGNK